MAPHNMQEPSASVPAVGGQARPVVFRHPWDAHINEFFVTTLLPLAQGCCQQE